MVVSVATDVRRDLLAREVFSISPLNRDNLVDFPLASGIPDRYTLSPNPSHRNISRSREDH